MSGSSPLIRFQGPVRWVTGPGAAGITLLGNLLEADGSTTPAQLSLSAMEGAELPQALNDLVFEALSAQDLLLRSTGRDWHLRCRTWQLHRDAGAAFYSAIPPRPTPWGRRTTWRLLLGVAATAPGRWLLARRAR